jgi:hypothetical protein
VPRRNPVRRDPPPLSASTRDCPFGCGRPLAASHVACGADWDRVPGHLKQQWLEARRGGDFDEIADARSAIELYAEQRIAEGSSR